MLWLLMACEHEPEDSAPRSSVDVLASELYGDGWAAWSLPQGQELGRLRLSEHHPEVCAGEGDLCLNYQARAQDSADGAQVLYTFTPMNIADGDDLSREDRHGWIAAVSWPQLSPLWAVSRLDFSGLPEGEAYCRWSEQDACTPAADLPDREYHRCFLYQPHELALISDDGAQVQLWVTDSRNARLLRLGITPGDDCAQVLEVLGQDHPDWGNFHAPNALERWVEGDTEHLLISMKDSFGEGGADGKGALTLWTRSLDQPFSLSWRYPPEGSWYNSPHGLTRAEGPEGEPLLLFAHSAALGPDWNEGPGGTVGMLSLADSGPTHLADLTVPGGLNYPRDLLPLGPGEALIVDSGCKGGLTCDRSSGVWWVDLPQAQASGLTGAYGESLSPQELKPQGPAMLTEAARLYSVEPLEPSP